MVTYQLNIARARIKLLYPPTCGSFATDIQLSHFKILDAPLRDV